MQHLCQLFTDCVQGQTQPPMQAGTINVKSKPLLLAADDVRLQTSGKENRLSTSKSVSAKLAASPQSAEAEEGN